MTAAEAREIEDLMDSSSPFTAAWVYQQVMAEVNKAIHYRKREVLTTFAYISDEMRNDVLSRLATAGYVVKERSLNGKPYWCIRWDI